MKRPVKIFIDNAWILFFLAISALIWKFSYGTGNRKNYDFIPAIAATQTITFSETQEHVETLASDKFEGREAGTKGEQLAADYIASYFKQAGLKPGGDAGTFFQHFKISKRRLIKIIVSFKTKSETTLLNFGSDYIPLNFTGENKISGEIVFAGYGISAPEYNYDDYQNIDVQNKIVLVLRHEPREEDDESPFEGSSHSRYAYFETKARTAKNHGAAALIIVNDPNGEHSEALPKTSFQPKGRFSNRWSLAPQNGMEDIPVIWVKAEFVESLLAEQGRDLTSLQKQIDEELKPQSFTLKNVLSNIELEFAQQLRTAKNVVAVLPGSDENLAEEAVVVGAHYDHVGIKGGEIHNGADDNASGTAGLLEIAEACAEMKEKPNRTLIFAAFSAEELGLLGSKYYVDNPVRPISKTVVMLNMDMIGRNLSSNVSVIGAKRYPKLSEINIAANEMVGMNLKYDADYYFNRSDQANFAREGVPVLFYNTNGHGDYHQPTDDFDKINFEKIARIGRLAFLVAWQAANFSDLLSQNSN